MNEELENLNVITIEEHDVFGNYSDDELKQAMNDLYIHLKGEIDKHYTTEEQLEYHSDYLIKLLGILKNETLDFTNVEILQDFLKIYNEVSSNFYSVETIQIAPSDEALVIRYICKYGLKTYKSNFNNLKLKFYKNDKVTETVELKLHEIESFIIKFLESESEYVRTHSKGMDLIDTKNHYVTSLSNRLFDLERGVLELIVLEQVIDDYNYEYENVGREIQIIK